MKTVIKNSLMAIGFLGIMTGLATQASAAYFNTTPLEVCNQNISRTLQIGSQNSDVWTLQNFLSRAGYLNAYPNGHFGHATKRAVMNFQADNYLVVSGVVGEATRNALNERLCDQDVSATSYDDGYGYNSGVTYVDGYDPYAIVVSPQPSAPTVYATPQANISYTSTRATAVTTGTSVLTPATPATVITPAASQVQSTGIVYSSNLGYVIGVTPKAQSITVITPQINAVYKEGDTVYLNWTTSNLNASGYVIVLENKITKQSRTVAVTSSNNATFVLSKDLLDAVCSGVCDNSQQGSFSIVITTPVTDIAGNTSTFRAAVSPITINRPFGAYGFGAVSITSSKTPVNSNEAFKLYVNIPTGASWNNNVYGNYTFKIHVSCPSGVTVSLAGAACGQDFVIPFAPSYFQQEIPVIVNNPTWFKQNVNFQLIVSTLNGQVIGSSDANVVVNGAPFNW